MPAKARKTPTLKIERRLISDLLRDPANARQHDERNLDAIRASLRRFGQQKPIVIDATGIVVAGNGTMEAAVAEGWDGLDVVVFPGTAEEARAYAIVDNRTGELSSWDESVLLEQLGTLPTDLMSLAGWDAVEYDDLLASVHGAAGGINGAADYPGHVPTASLDAKGQLYGDKETRAFYLEYPNEQFVWVLEQLERARAKWDLESNAAALVAIVERYYKIKAPVVSDD